MLAGTHIDRDLAPPMATQRIHSDFGGSRDALRAHLAMLLMVCIWGVNFSIVKDAFTVISPLAFNALRFPFAAAIVTVAHRRRSRMFLPDRKDVKRLLVLGLLGNVVYQLCFVFGLANTRASTASVLLAGTPIVTAVLSVAVGHEKLSKRVWTGVIIACTGIVLVVGAGSGTGGGQETVLGDVLMIAATIAWAVYSVGSRDLIRHYGAVAVTAWSLWAGTLGMVVIGLPDVLSAGVLSLSLKTWFAVAYAGALSVGVAYVLWSYGVRHLGNTRTATYSNLVPVIAVIVAWSWLGERPGAGQLLGATIIILGVMLAQRRDRARVSAAPRAPLS
jgi:drug/metabolite transporter (DMT)-like permease